MSDTVPPLEGTQARIREEYFEHDSGLFVLDCKPGFGKSTTLNEIAAETLVRADAAGEQCPEQQLCVVSFSREDAASIEPGIKDALDAFAADTTGTYPVDISVQTARRLKRRLQLTDQIGTIDSVLRSIFEDIAAELGFDGMPSVGNTSQLSLLRQQCMASIRTDESYARQCQRLDAAYPPEDDADGDRLHGLLENARAKKRDRRLSTAEFESRLRATIDDVYPNGPPQTRADLLADISAFYSDAVAAEFEQTLPADQTTTSEAVLNDQDCYQEWHSCVDDFCTLLDAYERAYDDACRKQGVVSHADIAYWIAEYFDRTLTDVTGASQQTAEAYRDRVQRRYATKFQSLIIDEAQDISIAQHDALAPFVSEQTRVLMAGDVDQCIYVWRNARPEQFGTAFDGGEYFGTNWSVHHSYSGSQTYRMRPDIATAVDTIFGDVFTDLSRGGGETVTATTEYTPLNARRSASADPAVHVAAYSRPADPPGTPDWFEAEQTPLANYLAGGIADGTLDVNTDGDDTITVLFSRRLNMDALEAQLSSRGLSVVNASAHLFENPLVTLICRVVWWLVDPYDPERTREFIHSECLPLSAESTALFKDVEYRIDEISERIESEGRTATEDGFIAGLETLAHRRGRQTADPAEVFVEKIIETLCLRADPLDQNNAPDQRLAACDALLSLIADWESDDRYTVEELAKILEGYVQNPTDGIVLPVSNPEQYDVIFRTIHNMKGDEDDVVCVADLSGSITYYGPQNETFLAFGETLALAPPETVSRTDLTPSDQGPTQQNYGSLRWASDVWIDGQIAGAPSLSDVSQRYCAEQWRLLYVALSRARDHLVISLPSQCYHTDPNDAWSATIADALSTDQSPSRGQYEIPALYTKHQDTLTVGINDVTFPKETTDQTNQPTPRSAQPPADNKAGWTSRYINGTSLYQLTSNTDKSTLPHIMGRRPEINTVGSTATEMDLPAGSSQNSWELSRTEF
ncbi:UvrD-helicase domain-containing protein [Halovenus salina]|uniref:UvrD-helicase domain-containing protein n=1 Tax=Halovenus salina TaxID=1510225 RepID=A0ABD5W7E7_9EURY